LLCLSRDCKALDSHPSSRNVARTSRCSSCSTYQLLGNELDGPRGRIYLIKQTLAGEPVRQKTPLHLDRCLCCRNCETTCPSGVTYQALLDRPCRAGAAHRAVLVGTLAARGFARRDPAFGGIRRAPEDRPRNAAVSSGRAWT
jgi:Fe-S oxidoreductase